MARSEARLQFGIWQDGLAGATPGAKLLYCVLLTEPTLNHCGVGRICLPLWAANAGLSEENTRKALDELCEGTWVLADEHTYEIFVRSMIRNDGVSDQPYVLKGALREAMSTRSKRLRIALAAELRRLPPRKPDGTSKVGKRVTYPDPHETADLLDPPPEPKPTRKAPETLSDSAVDPSESVHGGGGGGGVGGGTSVGTNSTSVDARKRGTRIPDDFALTADMIAWVRENCPTVDGRSETDRFKDHFTAAPGQKGVKLDWLATWRNWIRTAAERAPHGGPPRYLAPVQASLPADPHAAFAELRDQADAQRAAQLVGIAYVPRPQPPSDETPVRTWNRTQSLHFIDSHRDEILAAIIERKPA